MMSPLRDFSKDLEATCYRKFMNDKTNWKSKSVLLSVASIFVIAFTFAALSLSPRLSSVYASAVYAGGTYATAAKASPVQASPAGIKRPRSPMRCRRWMAAT